MDIPRINSAEIDMSDVLKVRKMIPSYKGTSIEKIISCNINYDCFKFSMKIVK